MLPTTSGGSSFAVALPDEAAMQRLMIDVASILEPGDLVTLSGDLGAGKTTFARALIRYLAGDETIEVPSPSYTLLQAYDLPRYPIVHADLYRLSGPGELAELGFDDLPPNAVVLLEWPDRAAGYLPSDRLDITLTLAPRLGPQHRNARVTGYGKFEGRVERASTVRRFLETSGYTDARRERVQGDASTRLYERLTLNETPVILMNAPPRPDGPPVRDGRSYSALAHLAEDVRPFVAMANGLRERGFSAPEILRADLDHGLLILEDLGDERVVDRDPPEPIEERYGAAVEVLVALHLQDLPRELPVAPGETFRIPDYDIDAFLIEAELLLDWYLPSRGAVVSTATRAAFDALWRETLWLALDDPPTWVLRDYHSPNLLWLPDRADIARIGILDFQDVQIGPAAYDLASLLQDARVDVAESMEVALINRYASARRDAGAQFDTAKFVRVYAALAAQRATKILGIFARLDRRDGKPQYLRHMPRLWGYLQRSLAHPALAPLSAWYGVHVPAPPADSGIT
jgi:tRNA threonylcarbamoyl adenosine modification protein YjeE